MAALWKNISLQPQSLFAQALPLSENHCTSCTFCHPSFTLVAKLIRLVVFPTSFSVVLRLCRHSKTCGTQGSFLVSFLQQSDRRWLRGYETPKSSCALENCSLAALDLLLFFCSGFALTGRTCVFCAQLSFYLTYAGVAHLVLLFTLIQRPTVLWAHFGFTCCPNQMEGDFVDMEHPVCV